MLLTEFNKAGIIPALIEAGGDIEAITTPGQNLAFMYLLLWLVRGRALALAARSKRPHEKLRRVDPLSLGGLERPSRRGRPAAEVGRRRVGLLQKLRGSENASTVHRQTLPKNTGRGLTPVQASEKRPAGQALALAGLLGHVPRLPRQATASSRHPRRGR